MCEGDRYIYLDEIFTYQEYNVYDENNVNLRKGRICFGSLSTDSFSLSLFALLHSRIKDYILYCSFAIPSW